MGARRLRVESEEVLLERLAPPVAAASRSEHDAVDSPAMLLQRRLDAAIAAAPWGGRPEPAIAPWSGSVRVAILVAGAAGGWAAAWAAVRALI